MKAKETLNDIRKMGMEIDSLQEEIMLLRQEAEGLKAMELSDMPKGGRQRDASDIIAHVADLQQERFNLMLERIKKREQALLVIARIDSSDYRTLLLQRYILCKSWDDIVDLMHYSYSGVFKLHGAALKAFEQNSGVK